MDTLDAGPGDTFPIVEFGLHFPTKIVQVTDGSSFDPGRYDPPLLIRDSLRVSSIIPLEVRPQTHVLR